MGEIDTKSIESVQTALSLFGEKGHQKKYRTGSIDGESDRDEIQAVQQELANCKVQLEAKESAHKQVLLKLQQCEERVDELSAMLVKSEIEKGLSVKESRDAESRANELESKVVEMTDQVLETAKIREQLSDVLNELQAKSVFIESLQRELHEANELLSLSERAASDAVANGEALEAELEIRERYISDRIVYTEVIEMELSRLKLELSSQNENVSHLNGDLEVLTGELEEAKAELAELKERENDAEVEMALLKSELHKARSRIAAAEAAEMRVNSVKSGLYLAVQQLAVEAEEAKKENLRLRHGVDETKDEAEAEAEAEADFSFSVDSQIETPSLDKELPENNEASTLAALEEYESLIRDDETADQMSTMENSDQGPQSETDQEVELLKKELEAAMAKIGEFRNRAEQAMSRAESAEKAKSALEDQLKIWRERKQRRKAALAALREESTPRKFDPPATTEKSISTHPPLFKVLNMKF